MRHVGATGRLMLETAAAARWITCRRDRPASATGFSKRTVRFILYVSLKEHSNLARTEISYQIWNGVNF